MNKVLYTILFFGLISCGSDSSVTESAGDASPTEKTETTEPEIVKVPIIPNKSVDTLSAKQLKMLKPYLKTASINELDAFIKTLRLVKTDTAFEKAYHSAKPLIEKLQVEFSKKNMEAYELTEQLKFMDQFFAVRPSCVAECTEFVIDYDFKELLKLAKETQGTADDEFIEMKIYCEGDQATYNPGWFTYFERTWDYGGGVNLGDNSIYKFLKKSYAYQKKTTLFKTDVDQLRSETIGIMGHPVYMQSQEKVLAELDKIVKEGVVSKKEKAKLLEYRTRNEDVKKADEPLLQFDCATKDCDWGG